VGKYFIITELMVATSSNFDHTQRCSRVSKHSKFSIKTCLFDNILLA
jgi:hypothetical protein